MPGYDVISRSGDVADKDNVTLLSKKGEFTSSRRNVFHGKYYFEYTHIEGTNQLLIGFHTNDRFNSVINIFLNNMLPSACIYIYGEVQMEGWSKFQDLNLTTIGNNHTIGLGIDADNKQFLIRSMHEVRIIQIKDHPNIKSWNIHACNHDAEGSRDVISINFGQRKFKYEIPFGFSPWNGIYKFMSCKSKINEITKSLFLYVMLIS